MLYIYIYIQTLLAPLARRGRRRPQPQRDRALVSFSAAEWHDCSLGSPAQAAAVPDSQACHHVRPTVKGVKLKGTNRRWPQWPENGLGGWVEVPSTGSHGG